MKSLIIYFSILLVSNINAQTKEITLEDIWSTGKFKNNTINGLLSMKDGIHYSTMKNDTVFRFSYEKSSIPEVIICKSKLLVNGENIGM